MDSQFDAVLKNETAGDAPPADPAPAAPAPTRQFTAEMAADLRATAERTFKFELEHTRPGTHAMVRKLDFTDSEILSIIPEHLLTKALEMAVQLEKRKPGQTIEDALVDEMDMATAVQVAAQEAEIARKLCVAGFAKPQLIMREEDRTSEDQVYVDLIHRLDRRAYMWWVMTETKREADVLARFPAGPAETVAPGMHLREERPPAERTVASRADGV